MDENDIERVKELKVAEEAMVQVLGRTEKSALICVPVFDTIMNIRGLIRTLENRE